MAVGNIDRLVFAGLYRLVPEVLDTLKILDGHPLASRFPSLVAVEIATAWPTKDTCGASPTH